MQIDQTFSKRYECQIISELPNQELKRFYYPGANQDGGRDGLLLKIVPQNGEVWIGIFGFGDVMGLTNVYSCPNENQICVISRGDGYIVSVENPLQYQRVKVSPVIGAYPALKQELIVFHDFTDFIAYGKTGLAWRSKRISYDGINIERLDGDFLVGQSRDAPTGKQVSFRLNLWTGIHDGGSYPPN
jgi:hypothetical protein